MVNLRTFRRICLLVFVLLLPSVLSAAETTDQARQHLLAGRTDAALTAYQANPHWLEFDASDLIAEARKHGDQHLEQRLTEFYLQHYPITADVWSFRFISPADRATLAAFSGSEDKRLSWVDIAVPYYREQRGDSAAAKQTTASLPLFEKFREACCQEDASHDACRKFANEFLEKYPQSEFCAPVVFNCCFVIDSGGRFGEVQTEVSRDRDCYEDFVKRVDQVGATPRCRLLVKALFANQLRYTKDEGVREEQVAAKLRRSVTIYQEVAAQSDRPYEKVAYLFEAGLSADYLEGPDALAINRKLLDRIMADYPNHPRCAEARLKYLYTYLKEDKLAEALAQTRAWDDAGERDLSAELHAIAEVHRGRKEFPIAQKLCEEITARYPDGAATGAAYLELAYLHQEAGREQDMLAAFRQAAVSKSSDTHYGVMDAGNTKSQAHEFLGEYYMEKQDWAEALHWWESWEPSSWCGNCLMSMHSTRKKQMEVCRSKLKQP